MDQDQILQEETRLTPRVDKRTRSMMMRRTKKRKKRKKRRKSMIKLKKMLRLAEGREDHLAG